MANPLVCENEIMKLGDNFRVHPIACLWFHLNYYPLLAIEFAGKFVAEWAEKVNCNNVCRCIGSSWRQGMREVSDLHLVSSKKIVD